MNHIHVCYWVDYLLISFNDHAAAAAFKTALLTRFDGTDDGPVRKYVGIDITRTATHTNLSQEPLARELLEKCGMAECNPVLSTPLDPGVQLLDSDLPSVPGPEFRRKFQSVVSTLQYFNPSSVICSISAHILAQIWCSPQIKWPNRCRIQVRFTWPTLIAFFGT